MGNSLRGSPYSYIPTHHAVIRMKQRRFSFDDVRFIIRNGEECHEGGNLRSYYIPDSPFAVLVGDSRLMLLAGSLVVVDVGRGRIVTVYDRYLDEIGFADWGMI
jgi:hypothetical protein